MIGGRADRDIGGYPTEGKGFRKGEGDPALEATVAAGDEFIVDFVRVYDIVE